MCDNCGCKTAEIEITIEELLKKQADDRAQVFRPILKKMVDYLKESDVDAFIEPDEFAAITIVTKNWEASLDLINFYEKEENKKDVDTRVDVITDEDDDDDEEGRLCSSCLTDEDDEPSELKIYDAPKKKAVKKPKKGKTTKRKSKGK